MNKTTKIVAMTALAGMISAGTVGVASAAKLEKCYGVVKAGANDCATSNSSCAGTSTKDGQKDAFVMVPQGLCDRLANGSGEAS